MSSTTVGKEQETFYQNEMASLAQSRISDLMKIIDSIQDYLKSIPSKLDTPILVQNNKDEMIDSIMQSAEMAESEIINWLMSLINRSGSKGIDEDGNIPFFLKCDLDNIDRSCGFKLSKRGMIDEAIKKCKQ